MLQTLRCRQIISKLTFNITHYHPGSAAMSLAQLSRLIGLPDSELQQVLDTASSLSKAEAADLLKGLLGDEPQAIEFISAFNSRRNDPRETPSSSAGQPNETDAVPKYHRASKKKKTPLHTPAARQVTVQGPAPGTVYNKRDREDDYIWGTPTPPSNAKPPPPRVPPSSKATGSAPKQPPSAAGTLVSDLLAAPKSKPKSNPVSRTSTPGPAAKSGKTAKVSITGGTPMHGASTLVTDLDAAIRSLEITTNPSLSSTNDVAARRCDCLATRHPLQAAAPNCLNCGKVICIKEGLGQCTFCGTPLLTPSEVQAMIKELKAERGREKMAADREAHRRADVSGTPRPFTNPRDGVDLSAAEAKAREHRDRLLGFQAQNARRTTVRDEAADFDVSAAVAGGSGGSIWASPEERALELRRQQKILREMEWNARPEYEKRQTVVSIDIGKGKVVKKTMAVVRPPSPAEDHQRPTEVPVLKETDANRGTGGAFGKNPLLGAMIRPVYDAKEKGSALEGRAGSTASWRRVQDDLDDNEAVILDGGLHGGTL